ncbi:hypothetical protein [Clostridium butyricum]|uniref:hypothetical protein n=1 Tax=Clostridium butyricum TaxID=1492 RepID=UPI0013D03E16|nr:hypothetical protein [Clostridium butyricum]MCQ2016805.1 hypothetical protein [Clostridium butyricum]MCQ2022588.1 hypothetical protein [Clostridium butyricum]NFB69542.1 hypothetical protein [Clostridium butyricum]NFB90403.1 hypothetical protein [Clostridium butyricum]UTY54130.1 hypothetical protein HNS01_13865 [Clostridium butyricum]
MQCKKCGSDNVNVQVEQVGGKTSVRKSGCLWGLGRLFLIICTCGLWLLIGRRKGTNNTKFKNKTVCVCQNCGYKWYIS